jgi:ATP-dependent RNA helicase RhlE
MTPEIEQAVAASPFTALGLSVPLVRAVLEEGYAQPSPVQTEVVPRALEGRDVLAGAQTGTGKTAAFVLPILQQLAAATSDRPSGVRALILTPTRELAAQIADRVSAYGRYLRIRHAVIYGGVSQHRQELAMREKPDLLVATPGRLLDLMQQGFVRLDEVAHFVLDEADRMLDMGFVHDVRRVVAALPSKRQTLFFSATIAGPIETLARTMLVNPARVSITPTVTTAEGVEQSVFFVDKADKRALLERVLREAGQSGDLARTLVFTRTKHGANRLSEQLDRAGIGSAAIHGNKSQGARERALDGFRRGTTRVLVATDVAARGIDVEGVSLVVNFDLPNVAESYVHRIGRTGRAGATGRAISFCDREERSLLADIERLIRRRLPVAGDERVERGAPAPAAPQQATGPRPALQNRHRGYTPGTPGIPGIPGQGPQRVRER